MECPLFLRLSLHQTLLRHKLTLQNVRQNKCANFNRLQQQWRHVLTPSLVEIPVSQWCALKLAL
jgi:hypothetical protein